VLVQEEIGHLQDAVDTLTKRKTRKWRYVPAEETLTVREVYILITTREGETPAKRVRAARRCSCCSEVGHNSRNVTCKVEIMDVDNSNTSK
jgi:hypothetical protein